MVKKKHFGLGYYKKWTENFKNLKEVIERNTDEVIEATEQEVFEALKNEADNIGYINNLQSVRCLHGFIEEKTQEYYNKKGKFYFEKYANKLWIQYGSFLDICIFDNGTWATIIETITKEEAERLLNKKIV